MVNMVLLMAEIEGLRERFSQKDKEIMNVRASSI